MRVRTYRKVLVARIIAGTQPTTRVFFFVFFLQTIKETIKLQPGRAPDRGFELVAVFATVHHQGKSETLTLQGGLDLVTIKLKIYLSIYLCIYLNPCYVNS